MSEDQQAVVVDAGSSLIKAGLSGDVIPDVCFPTVIGEDTSDVIITKERFVGNEAQEKRDILSLHYPIQRGIVTNWDDMEAIWGYMLKNISVPDAETLPVLSTEVPFNPKQNRENMAEMIFETFSTSKFHVSLSPVLSVYGSGLCSAVVLESGHGVTSVFPLYDGFPIVQAIKRVDFGGSDVTAYLTRLLSEKNFSFITSSERKLVSDMKEKICSVLHDPYGTNATMQTSTSFELPDGQTIKLADERHQCTEVLFQPTLLSESGHSGVHELIFESVMNSHISCRQELLKNVILSGGNSLFSGLKERIEHELCKLVPSTTTINVQAFPDREIYAWYGGSIVASLSSFQSLWISRDEYTEHGPSIVHRKCFVV